MCVGGEVQVWWAGSSWKRQKGQNSVEAEAWQCVSASSKCKMYLDSSCFPVFPLAVLPWRC